MALGKLSKAAVVTVGGEKAAAVTSNGMKVRTGVQAGGTFYLAATGISMPTLGVSGIYRAEY